MIHPTPRLVSVPLSRRNWEDMKTNCLGVLQGPAEVLDTVLKEDVYLNLRCLRAEEDSPLCGLTPSPGMVHGS